MTTTPAPPMALEDTTWFEDGLDLIESLALNNIQFDADYLRRLHREAPHPNMWGRLMSLAHAREYVTRTGYKASTRREAHGRAVAVWARHPRYRTR